LVNFFRKIIFIVILTYYKNIDKILDLLYTMLKKGVVLEKIEEKSLLNPMLLDNKKFAWLLLGISIFVTIIDNFLKMDYLIGAWHIVIYLTLLIPLTYMVWQKRLNNIYTKWFIPILLVMIFDMFYYSNDFVQFIVPILFYLLLIVLYLTSMQTLHSPYQSLIPRFGLKIQWIEYIQEFLSNLIIKEDNNKIYARIGFALLITIPFLIVFIALLFSADTNFGNFMKRLIDFDIDFHIKYILTVPLTLFLYLWFFIYSFSNYKKRVETSKTTPLDMLIVGIFLSMINLLFLTFISVQVPFLIGHSYLPANTTLAEFAREGFFQLMMVMGIVLLIFLFIMRRFKGERLAIILLGGLIVETIIMGVVSLKKMYLYQSIKGATVLRYYVEWFDYFLISILIIGLIFLIKDIKFSKMLDILAIFGLISLAIVISIDIDYMVASHNIKKFKDTPEKLDKKALATLSIDALPIIKESGIKITQENHNLNHFYEEYRRKNCKTFSTYHFGYCSKLKRYSNLSSMEYHSYN